MLSNDQVKALIVNHVKNHLGADGQSPSLPSVCLLFASMFPENLCADEVMSLCLDLEREGQVSLSMDADGTISVY